MKRDSEVPIFGANALTIGNNILLMGGRAGGSSFRQNLSWYSPANNTTWETVASFGAGRSNASSVYTGQYVYYFGGNTQTGRTDEILRYEPATNTVATLATHLLSPRGQTAAYWDGSYAYILGGSTPTSTDEILRFDPALGTIVRMTARLPSPRHSSSVIFDGNVAYIFGGIETSAASTRPDVLAYAGANDREDGKVLRTDGVKVLNAIDIVHARHYSVNLTGVDTYNNTVSDARAWAVDQLAPVLISNVSAQVWSNTGVSLSWLVLDNESGIASAVVEKRQLSSWTNVTEPPTVGVSAWPLSVSLAFGGHGVTQELRVRATDRAGNEMADVYVNVTFDNQPPDMVAMFNDLVAGAYSVRPNLRSSGYAWDNVSGLSEGRLSHLNSTESTTENVTTFTTYVTNAVMEAIRPTNLSNVYQLRFAVTDNAGNTNVSTFGTAEAYVPPQLNVTIPEGQDFNVSRVLPLDIRSFIPGFVSETTDYLFTEIRDSSNATVWSHNTTTPTLNETIAWNASAAPAGNYSYRVEARERNALTETWGRFNVTGVSTPADWKRLDQFHTYGELYNANDAAVYRFTHSSDCGVGFTMRLRGLNNTDVDLYVASGAPGSNPADYPDNATSTNTSEIVNIKIATPTQYSVMVRQKNNVSSPFVLEHAVTNDCSSGGTHANPPNRGNAIQDAGGTRYYFANFEMQG